MPWADRRTRRLTLALPTHHGLDAAASLCLRLAVLGHGADYDTTRRARGDHGLDSAAALCLRLAMFGRGADYDTTQHTRGDHGSMLLLLRFACAWAVRGHGAERHNTAHTGLGKWSMQLGIGLSCGYLPRLQRDSGSNGRALSGGTTQDTGQPRSDLGYPYTCAAPPRP